MTFATGGALLIDGDLETRAINLLKWKVADERNSLDLLSTKEEIEFLFNKGYIVKKELPSLEYEITSKGKEYSLSQ